MDQNLTITILAVAAPIVGLLWRYLKTKWRWLDVALEKTKIDDIAEGAVTEVYQDYVRELKAKSEDGVLTADEKKEAMRRAVEKFKTVAKDQGLPALRELAEPIIKALLEKAINRMKGSAATVIAPATP
jgi:hypothetical protein